MNLKEKIEKLIELHLQELQTNIELNIFNRNKLWKEGYLEGMEDTLKNELGYLIDSCHENAVFKGFWDAEIKCLSDMLTQEEKEAAKKAFQSQRLMLIVSELSEALEALRNGDEKNHTEKLADVLIRIFDYCGGYGISLERAVMEKMDYNCKREKMHGKKF